MTDPDPAPVASPTECEAALHQLWGPASSWSDRAAYEAYERQFIEICQKLPDDALECVLTRTRNTTQAGGKHDPSCEAKLRHLLQGKLSTSSPQKPTVSNWSEAYDLDGDGTKDSILSEFTGGGHCCYRIGVELSSTGATTMLPFLMDGGYPVGLDLSQPHQFTVRTRDGNLPEIVYEIATYNGVPYPLEHGWTKRWGIRSHRVALCSAGGRVRVSDESSNLPACKR